MPQYQLNSYDTWFWKSGSAFCSSASLNAVDAL